ncbi:hypothetical protein K461DRAFT_299350 [Myriangium duriaei CBS 260.36]|uniref:Zn(2)-C6 fungal-type domain-containing protein n=1 Tax=Myriangium duriaei CBS 260.36 TaxID=1168546 RepID=A0A9P4J8V7_9PEZI|nr:hypothetical protein K461DRAFT_299350 [Myriangium duriaei CBS 260.36]
MPHAHGSDKSLASHGGDDTSRARDKDKEKDKESDATPAWAELKTKAGKDRKRLPLACITCRRKKIRCSGEKPACKHCMRSRIPCVYKVTTRKAAPRTDYMAMLDKRLKRMEERVIKIMPKDEQRNIDVIGRAVVKPALPGVPSKPESKKRVADEAFGDELDNWSKVKGSAAGIKGQGKGEDQLRDDIMVEGSDFLPSPEIQQHLAEVFFDYVYGQAYHLLHKPSYMRKLEAGQLPPVLILSVCGVSARFSSHPEVRSDPAFLRGEKWAKPAREIALKRYDTPNITILICYLLLGLHEFGTCQGGRSWMLGGMAQRMAYALQLHKDLDHGPPSGPQDDKNDLTFTDREIRRRTMWACFIMDRFNSSGTDRPMFVAESYIEAQLPVKEQYFQMEITGPTEKLEGTASRTVEPESGQVADAKENMGVAAFMVRAVSIWGHVVRYVNLGGRERDTHPMWSEHSGFYKLKGCITDYRTKLPGHLQWNEENLRNHATLNIGNQFIFLHLIINQINLFMNRFALPVSGTRPQNTKDMPPDFLNDCARTALDAASQISTLVNQAHDYRVTAPFAGYSAFFSSTVHIHGLSSKNPAIEASSKQYLAWNVKYLSRMKKYWGMFHFVTEHLKDLYRRQIDASVRAQHGVATPAGSKSQEGIFQYGDWFDRYPHGVSGTDYEDGSSDIKKEKGADALFGQKPDLQSVEEFFSKLSPQTRAAQSRKAAKRKQSKSAMSSGNAQGAAIDGPTSSPSLSAANRPQHQRQQSKSHTSKPASLERQQTNEDAFANGQQTFGQGPAGFMQQLQNMHRPGIMSHLDRHMVLSSYAGMSGSGSNTPGNPLHTIDPMNFPNDLDMQNNSYGFAGNDGSQMPGLTPGQTPAEVRGMDPNWNDASSLSWFMPFNVDPPSAMGDDSSLFGSSYDFGSMVGGLGGFGGDGMGGLDGLGGGSSGTGGGNVREGV